VYLTKITDNGSTSVPGAAYTLIARQNMPPNIDYTHNLHNWTIICNFSYVQFNASWWWILLDPKHVGVVSWILKHFKQLQVLVQTTIYIIECISWIIMWLTHRIFFFIVFPLTLGSHLSFNLRLFNNLKLTYSWITYKLCLINIFVPN
jgi:hypothetical protein